MYMLQEARLLLSLICENPEKLLYCTGVGFKKAEGAQCHRYCCRHIT